MLLFKPETLPFCRQFSIANMEYQANFRFYDSLNDFLPKWNKESQIEYYFDGKQAVKDAIEALGIPHTEVALILIDQEPVTFQATLKPAALVEVFPLHFNFPAIETNLLLPPFPEPRKFVLDVHLGKLAKALRMLGFDTLYRNDYSDRTLAELALKENRIILTRDVDLLKIKTITWGYWLRSQHLPEQLAEVIRYFHLQNQFQPFSRCLECNGLIREVAKEKVLERLPPNTRQYFNEFYQCENCGNVYWKGSHFERMLQFVENFRQD